MNYLTFSGNSIINAKLPEGAKVHYAPTPIKGIKKRDVPLAVKRAFENPMGMDTLSDLLDASSKVLIAFDDNCQPFPETALPDIRQQAIETLLPMLYACGVKKQNIELICAVALHRKMKRHELQRMVGKRLMDEFYPHQLNNFDAEDPEAIATLEDTEEGEPVTVYKGVVESDLVIYVDTIQIPLNGGHKSVAVGLATYDSIASHHHPKMTEETPHVMQPDGSKMHDCIERKSRVIQKHSRIMVMEASMNNELYPFHLRYIGKPTSRCNVVERFLKAATPIAMGLLPETARRSILHSMQTAYDPIEINVGSIDAVHPRTMELMHQQMAVPEPKQYDTLVFGLPDLSPYSVDARVNPVLVVSDVLGYIFNWFYKQPLVKRGGSVIILNPAFKVFHPEYHVPYQRFYEDVLAKTHDPFEMKDQFEEKYARDPYMIDCYRNKFSHHGCHPFTVWYWATYAFSYLSKVILVGPKDDKVAKRLGVGWSASLDRALSEAREASGGDEVVALTIPPFMYTV